MKNNHSEDFKLINCMWRGEYEGGSKSLQPDQLFKGTEIKQLCCFST